MTTLNEITEEIQTILNTDWKRRDGITVPEAEDVNLGNDAVLIKGTVLYADLADSTSLVKGYKDWFVAEVYKTYLISICRLIKNNSGVITAFDGDRVMAVFIGDSKNSSAARTALQVNYLVTKVLNVELKKHYPNSNYQVQQSVGIDSSDLFVAKTGIRGANDLVWVGLSANYAAKLCSLREGIYSSFITESVFNMLEDKSKYGGEPKRSMWDKVIWNEQGIAIYRSSWIWQPD